MGFLNLKVLIGRYALISLNSLRNLTQCWDPGFGGGKGSSKKSSFRSRPDTWIISDPMGISPGWCCGFASNCTVNFDRLRRFPDHGAKNRDLCGAGLEEQIGQWVCNSLRSILNIIRLLENIRRFCTGWISVEILAFQKRGHFFCYIDRSGDS